jgi:hypothetical protein
MNLDGALAYLKANPSKKVVNLQFEGLHHVIMTTLEALGVDGDADFDPDEVFVDVTTSALFEDTDFAANTGWGTVSDQTGSSLADSREDIEHLNFLCADGVPGIFDKELTEYMLHDVFSALPHPDEVLTDQQRADFALQALPLVNDLFSNKEPELNYQVKAIVVNPTELISPLNLRSWLRSTLSDHKAEYKPGVQYYGFLFLTKTYSATLGKKKFDKVIANVLDRNNWIQIEIVHVNEPIDTLAAHRYVSDALFNQRE